MSITKHLFHPAINALSWTILHSIWQFALITLLWYFAISITSKSNAIVRYNLSLISFLAMPISFIITFFRQYKVYNNAGQIVSMEFEDTALMSVFGGTDFFLLDKSQPAFLSQFEAHTPLVFSIYLAGLVFFSIVTLLTYSKWYTLRRKHINSLPVEWSRQVRQLRSTAGIANHISVYLSSKVDIPMVVGFIKPVILLPVGMLSSLTTDQVEAIILHELYHIRRSDHNINALQCLLEILFFYHPACWLISRQLRREREKCVDEWVVEQTNKPLIYAEALINLEEKRSHTALQPAVAASQSKSLLFTRIKNFMTMKTRNFNAGQKLAAVMAIVAAFVSMAWINPATTISLFDSPTAGEHQPALLDHYDLAAFTKEEAAPDDPPEPGTTAPVNPVSTVNPASTPGKPTTIHLNDGKEVQWNALSEKDREQIMKAIEEAKLAIAEVNQEWTEKLQSGEFQMMIQDAQEDFQQGMEELNGTFNREEFQQEMEKARIEFEAAMQELREHYHGEEFQEEVARMQQAFSEAMKQLHEEFSGEELQMEMKQMGEAYRLAMGQLSETVNSEEFRESMRLAGESFRVALNELNIQFSDEEFQQEMKATGEAFRESMKSLHEIFGSEEFRKEMQQTGEALQKAMEALKELEDSKEQEQEHDQ
jgi:bla regulator protein blaR1